MKTITNIIYPLFALFAFACFALSPQARATCQHGCNTSNGNTFLGEDALINNTTGVNNTATGAAALLNNTTGSENTATGINALLSNTTGFDNTAIGTSALIDNGTGSNNVAIGAHAMELNTTGSENTATGQGALHSNTTGFSNTATGLNALLSNTEGIANTADGVGALNANTTGTSNTATGSEALFSNTTGSENTATGQGALHSNTTGFSNTATGLNPLLSNTTGFENTATGYAALYSNTTGISNTATGFNALLSNTTGGQNTAVGHAALLANISGHFDIAIGNHAGDQTDGDNNIDIGNTGAAGESNTIRIGGDTGFGQTQTRTFIAGIAGAAINGRPVMINGNGRLGTAPSSARYKDEIKSMDAASEVILALKPVTFRYKKEIDADRTPQFGLIAEDVEKVNPDLVTRDSDGKAFTVRYEAVNAMLLNEFLKEHRKVQDLEKGMVALTAQLKEQAAQIQKVSAHLEMSKPATNVVLNNP